MDINCVTQIAKRFKPDEILLLFIVFTLYREKKCDRLFIGLIIFIFIIDLEQGLLTFKV